jgi:hypothetical protein
MKGNEMDKIQIICGDFEEALSNMPYESVGRLFMALMKFAKGDNPEPCLSDDALAKTLFPVMKQHIIRNEEYRQAMSNLGKKGGAPKGNQNAKKTSENNLKQPTLVSKQPENKQKQAPNLTIPNQNNNKSVYKANQFTAGVLVQDYNFSELEKELIKN